MLGDVLLAARPRGPAIHPESRAFQLAEAGQGRVHVVTVVEEAGASPPEVRELGDDVAARRDTGRLGEVSVCEGEPWKMILREARSRGVSAIVVGPSSEKTDLQETLFGQTAERLAHRAPQPVLIVRRPAERPYEHVLVATDFSEGSRHALLTAAALTPTARLTLLHAYRVPFEGFLRDPANERDFRQTAKGALQRFLGEHPWPEGVLERLSPQLLLGDPDEAILGLDAEDPVDLAVLGAHGQTGPLEKLLGGTAERLLKRLPMDVMLVREPR